MGSNDAIQMRNISEMTPAELANVNGHFDLANKLHSLHVDLYRSQQQDGNFSKQHVYDYIAQNNYQIPPPPRPVQKWMKPDKIEQDPFGTLRAAKKISPSPEDSDDEVFIQNDKFGTLKANKMMQDYRDTSNKNTRYEISSQCSNSAKNDQKFIF